jgi:hypothetical protein
VETSLAYEIKKLKFIIGNLKKKMLGYCAHNKMDRQERYAFSSYNTDGHTRLGW